jgi:hypothetical protein
VVVVTCLRFHLGTERGKPQQTLSRAGSSRFALEQIASPTVSSSGYLFLGYDTISTANVKRNGEKKNNMRVGEDLEGESCGHFQYTTPIIIEKIVKKT